MAKGKYRDKHRDGAVDGQATAPEKVAAQPEQTTAQPDRAGAVVDDADAADKDTQDKTVWVYENTQDGPGTGRNLVDVDFARQAAEHEAGVEEKTYGIWGPIWRFLKWYDTTKSGHTFKKKVYLWLLVLTGWMGGHRYYQGRRILGLIYTLFFWTGVPFISCFLDAVEVIPLKPDENGYITL